jgi:hypothetical protein
VLLGRARIEPVETSAEVQAHRERVIRVPDAFRHVAGLHLADDVVRFGGEATECGVIDVGEVHASDDGRGRRGSALIIHRDRTCRLENIDLLLELGVPEIRGEFALLELCTDGSADAVTACIGFGADGSVRGLLRREAVDLRAEGGDVPFARDPGAGDRDGMADDLLDFRGEPTHRLRSVDDFARTAD